MKAAKAKAAKIKDARRKVEEMEHQRREVILDRERMEEQRLAAIEADKRQVSYPRGCFVRGGPPWLASTQVALLTLRAVAFLGRFLLLVVVAAAVCAFVGGCRGSHSGRRWRR